ncbi:hypothetical protein ADK55_07825 [Streptomyces sp. WM4235]|nr:hypothetical protein ADK55_07825 [Streptomyces sp. WM4235]
MGGGEAVDDAAQLDERGIRRRTGGPGGGAVRTSRTAWRTTARTVGSSRSVRPLWASVASRRVISSATSPLRLETAIRARWDRP